MIEPSGELSPKSLAKTGTEVQFSLEKPKRTSLIVLPTIRWGEKKIRSGLHTDRLRTLMSFLGDLSPTERQALKIEGRVLNRDQWERLQKDAIYQFFLNGREDRTTTSEQDEVVRLLLPKGLSLTHDDVVRLSQLAYSPSSNATTVGYTTGYFSAKDMFRFWGKNYSSNDFLPILGGCNEFLIGSDTLSPVKLKLIVIALEKKFVEATYDVVRRGTKLAIPEDRIRKIFDVHNL